MKQQDEKGEKKLKSAPIFIGGLAHSGKTQLRLILSAHSNINLTRRTGLWNYFFNRFGDLNDPKNFDQCLQEMMLDKRLHQLQLNPERICREFAVGARNYGRLFALIHTHFAAQLGKSRWGEQLGMFESYADKIFESYPTARMIHMIRDPRDRFQAATAKNRNRTGKVGWETARWIYSASLAERNQRLYTDRYKVVRFETFIHYPEQTLREIVSFIGEEWDANLLSSTETNDAVEETGRQAIYEASKQDFTFTQIYTRPYLHALQYPFYVRSFSGREWLLYQFVKRPTNRATMVLWNNLRAKKYTRMLNSHH